MVHYLVLSFRWKWLRLDRRSPFSKIYLFKLLCAAMTDYIDIFFNYNNWTPLTLWRLQAFIHDKFQNYWRPRRWLEQGKARREFYLFSRFLLVVKRFWLFHLLRWEVLSYKIRELLLLLQQKTSKLNLRLFLPLLIQVSLSGISLYFASGWRKPLLLLSCRPFPLNWLLLVVLSMLSQFLKVYCWL